jgi:hypothetical protein
LDDDSRRGFGLHVSEEWLGRFRALRLIRQYLRF